MTFLDKQKVKSRLTILAFGLFGLFIGWISDASAVEAFFVDRGCTASGCHDGPAVTPTCNGCHAHGSHPNSGKDTLNVEVKSDAVTYIVGDTITLTVTGGYKDNDLANSWVRVTIYDANGIVVAQSKGTCDASTSTGTACSNGLEMPMILQVVASATGAQMWTAGLYMNENDIPSSLGGLNALSTSVLEEGWIIDTNNDNHGEEIVAIPPFVVADDIPGIIKKGGGGSLSWLALGLLLFVTIGMLARDRHAKLVAVRYK